MRILFSVTFNKRYAKLSVAVKTLAKKRIELFQQDPFSPQLKTHKLLGRLDGFLAFSINQKYRIIFDFQDNETIRFHTIGTHDIY